MDDQKTVFTLTNFILVCVIVALLAVVLFQYRINREERSVGALQQYGMMGIYNNPATVVPEGNGTALNTDSNGQLITSTSSQAVLSN